MEKVRLKIVDSKNIYGTMNGGTIRLTNITESDKKMLADENGLTSEELQNYAFTPADKKKIFTIHRKMFAEEEQFDWHKMFMADQVDKNGSYFEITEEYTKQNPNGWTDINEDILVITDKNPGVVVGHPVADCPVVIMEDKTKGVTAVGHCSAELIDKKMPMKIADVLVNGYGSKEEDISAYVSARAGNSWTYDTWPKWATDSTVWEDGIVVDDNGLFHIDLRTVISKQLEERNISHVFFDPTDTITDPNYYSNSAASASGLNDASKFGRQFIGAVYQKERKAKSR